MAADPDNNLIGYFMHWRVAIAIVVGAVVIVLLGIVGNAVVTAVHSNSADRQERACVSAGKAWQGGNCR